MFAVDVLYGVAISGVAAKTKRSSLLRDDPFLPCLRNACCWVCPSVLAISRSLAKVSCGTVVATERCGRETRGR